MRNQDISNNLSKAARNCNIENLLLDLDDAMNVDEIMDTDGNPALHWACTFGNEDIVRAMLDLDANIDLLDEKDGNTALHMASMFGHANICKLLLERGADINAVDIMGGNTALHWACICEHVDIVRTLLRYDSDAKINESNLCGRTALHFASMVGNSEIIWMLVSNGANVNVIDDDGITPLDLATQNNQKSAIDLYRVLGNFWKDGMKQRDAYVTGLNFFSKDLDMLYKTIRSLPVHFS